MNNLVTFSINRWTTNVNCPNSSPQHHCWRPRPFDWDFGPRVSVDCSIEHQKKVKKWDVPVVKADSCQGFSPGSYIRGTELEYPAASLHLLIFVSKIFLNGKALSCHEFQTFYRTSDNSLFFFFPREIMWRNFNVSFLRVLECCILFEWYRLSWDIVLL